MYPSEPSKSLNQNSGAFERLSVQHIQMNSGKGEYVGVNNVLIIMKVLSLLMRSIVSSA